MVQAGQVVRLQGSTLVFLATHSETGGARHEMRVTYDPGSGAPPLHRHPHQTEVFDVEEGALLFTVAGEERRVGAGGSITLPADTVHTVRNASDEERAVARWTTRPALGTGDFFVALAATAGDGAAVAGVLAEHEREIRFDVASDQGA